MYEERQGKLISEAWQNGLDNFLDHAFSLPDAATRGKIFWDGFWQWRFKCDPSEQEKADGVLEENLTRKVK